MTGTGSLASIWSWQRYRSILLHPERHAGRSPTGTPITNCLMFLGTVQAKDLRAKSQIGGNAGD